MNIEWCRSRTSCFHSSSSLSCTSADADMGRARAAAPFSFAAAADAPIFFLLEIFKEEGPVVCAAAAEDSLVLTRALLRGLSGAGSGYLRRMLQKDSERRT